ncbi:basement membrane-specific heparan sulfate proteoglycan core protein-like [Coregonus clupeaformis]|uniref:basement membrane-specific heparan sulfate proteoglycan core protein-like n=1 Tax=Coregonus clupeaformis TaxID=59861 RepID=UPI001E1C60B0|nr:basement membrane-specific heparan sulfate proteoglycan core protein-like [Coregonus clupeaformis]
MEHTLLCVLLLLSTLINSGHSEDDDALPKATLTVKPNPAYTGETVTLTCSVGSDSSWSYQWLKDRNDNVVSQSGYSNIGVSHTISRAGVSDQGQYWCEGNTVSRPTYSLPSDLVTLTVKGELLCCVFLSSLPISSVSVSPQGLLYSGETVTLQCVIPGYTDWTYYWYKNNQSLPDETSKIIDITIPITQPGLVGQYRCEGTRTDRPQTSQPSGDITISVTALPKATLTVKPNPAYTGETVTLTCSVGSDSSWSYQWYKDRNDNVVSLSGRHTITGDTLTISRAGVSDQGQYWCQGEIRSRSISSIISDPVTITLNALPMASVKIVTPQGLLYPGETVTLQCDISDYTDWTYHWFRDNQVLPLQNRNTITISLPHQAGHYNCDGRRSGRPQNSYGSFSLPIIITALPKATLTVKPNPVFPGETVTLTCSVGSDSSWSYQWYKDRNYNVVSQSVRHTITGDTLTISRAAESDQGLYWCQGENRSRSISSIISDPVRVTLNGKKINTNNSRGLLYPGDTVTLQCDISYYTDWTYRWLRDNQVLPIQTRNTISITISLPHQAGQYNCVGRRSGRPQNSYVSFSLPIIITALPKATLTVKPNPVFPGETVTLTCSTRSDSRWRYMWYKDRNYYVVSQSVRHTITGDTLTISSVAESDQGQYWCQGEIRSRSISSIISDPVRVTLNDYSASLSFEPLPIKRTYHAADQIHVFQMHHTHFLIPTDSRPTATLSLDQANVFTGDRVTLTCTVESYGWKFYWYRHRPDSTPVTSTSGYSYSRVSVSDGGQYWCRAGRGDRVYYTLYSDPVQINITERPVAVLTLQPNWTQIFRGETVTMRCDIQGGDTDWGYEWYTNGYSVFSNTKSEYRISPVNVSSSGSYTCKGVKGRTFSKTSDAVQLTLSDQPKAVLSIYPQWLNPGDSVSLSCEVDKTSTGWRFSWYRTVPTLTEQSYSFQHLPEAGNGTTEDSYTLIPAVPTPTGGYVCRAGRGDPVYDTLYSEPQFLWSGDLQPSVSLRISPNTTQHFTSKSLSLSCEEKGNSTGWRLMSYRERGVTSGCGSNWGSITGSTCTISYTYTWSSGLFWCESGSGEYSNAVNITVNDGDVILESPVHPVTEGDFVTLSCKYRKVSSNFKADFYKDGVLIKNETTGEMTIPTVSKSDEGFYKCKSGQGESPESWVTVRVSPVVAPGSSTSVLVGVVVGLVVAGVLLVILLVLLWRNQNNKGSCFIRIFWPPQPQSTNQDPQQDQGSTQGQAPDTGYTHQQHGDANIYDTINPSDNNDNDAAGASAAGPSHVTYAQIQLNKLDKKKKVKRDYPKENPVYSEVKTGKATAAAGPVDVTYAEVDLQKKVKAKKKRETAIPPEAEPVYSLVKPYTDPEAAGPVDVTYAEVDLQKNVKAKKKRGP